MEQDSSPPPESDQLRRTQQVDNASRAILTKKPVPEIDFTIHTMEDGTQSRLKPAWSMDMEHPSFGVKKRVEDSRPVLSMVGVNHGMV
ncbi:hypothetical protein E4U13_003738 [Claviceps humidiphila]|uniref:Uncharacterized protein n=1 Tax=Claviceps humidiphila TaxID=1294629 RepID=A0A9P7TTK2_9HYPO|nr:hypothetical protein E4U13_003738 [Claviceps humidiphila]